MRIVATTALAFGVLVAGCSEAPPKTQQDAGRALVGLNSNIVEQMVYAIQDEAGSRFNVITAAARAAANVAYSTGSARAEAT